MRLHAFYAIRPLALGTFDGAFSFILGAYFLTCNSVLLQLATFVLFQTSRVNIAKLWSSQGRVQKGHRSI